MKTIFAYTFFFSLINTLNAQDLTGIWRGHFRSNNVYERMMVDDDRYKFEVQIAQKSKVFQAVTYSYKTTVFYGKAEAEGTMNTATRKALLKELKIVELRMSAGDACTMTCFLQYSKLGDEEYLQGTYTSMNTRDSSNCGKGAIFLRKVPESDFSKEPFLTKREKEIEREKHKIAPIPPPAATKPNNPIKKSSGVTNPAIPKTDSLKKLVRPLEKTNMAKRPAAKLSPKTALAKTDRPKEIDAHIKTDSIVKIDKKQVPVVIAPKVLTTRQNELVKTITVTTNEVELRIYDDGVIDNDTVSVYVDKKNVIWHAMLTDKPIIVKLHMDDDENYHEVVMVAENEGLFPPNTSLMVVQAGDKQYEVRIVSTEQKNAIVVFKFEKSKQ
ncbi:MAG TPA: hypothetical protein VNV85_18580 [Puia sp.]|jgi:hypothetical protein|nr:hypothetical protein [Puia sp.]